MSSRGSLDLDPAVAAARALGLAEDAMTGPALDAAARAAWERLGPPERAVIAALVELGGSAGAELLQDEVRDALASGADAAGARAAARLESAAEAAVTAAWESGLAARDRTSRTFFLLPELAAAFAPLVAEDLRSALEPLASPPSPLMDEHLACCALNIVRHDPVKLTREGTPFRRNLEVIAERLAPLLPPPRERDKDKLKDAASRVDAVLRLLRDLGLVRTVKDALEVDLEAVERWAALDPAARAATLLPGAKQGGSLRLLRLLQEVAPDRAWPPSVMARVLRRDARAHDAAEPSEPRPRAESAQETEAAADALERAGLIARTGSGRLALTAAGRAFPLAADVPRPKGVHVGHDLSVLVPRGLPASVHARLGEVAKLEQADQVARYRLDRGAVLESLDGGATPGELELFLAEHATPVLPDTVRDDLRRWAERFGEVTSRAGICVSCSVPRRHDEFDAVVARSGLAVARVAPGVAVVAPEDHAALCQALQAAGLTPRRRLQPLPRGASSSVPPRELASRAAAAKAWADLGELAAELAQQPGWPARARETSGRRAAPPPNLVVAQVKEKYRREFGSTQLASLDRLGVDELLSLEDKGLVRQYLSGRLPVPATSRPAPELAEYVGEEMVSVTPARARLVLEQASRTSLACQVTYVQGPGRTQVLVVHPLEIVTDGADTYVRARLPGSAQERMLATSRIAAVRVVRA